MSIENQNAARYPEDGKRLNAVGNNYNTEHFFFPGIITSCSMASGTYRDACGVTATENNSHSLYEASTKLEVL